MNIALIGFMGTGKSTVSRALRKKLSWEEVDMDAWIEAKEGCKISKIFEERGEQAFRDIETEAVKLLSADDQKILSCGGGAVLRACNVEALKKNGRIVLLTATPETVFQRVRHGKNRPILNGNMNVEFIAGLMEKRREAYDQAADIRIVTDGKTPDAIAGEIIEVMGLLK